MAANTGQRVVAFSLALLFFITTVATAAYVVWELSRENSVPDIAVDTQQDQTNQIQEEPPVDQQPTEIIDNFNGPYTIAELRFETITEGSGEVVQPGDTVTIHYTGALATNGQIFDSSVSRGEPATFPLGSLIQGWQEGIPGMKIGEKRRLFIPSALGYGAAGAGANIPPNSDLIFDIELFATTRTE
jgi:FKBP-type peptidyl-prolyl cis-trans isomerase